MTLQGSGAISLSQIRNELSAINGSYSLRSLSSTAGKGTPDAMSEFYGYQFFWTTNIVGMVGGGGGGWGGGGWGVSDSAGWAAECAGCAGEDGFCVECES
jgi:hypothetical protein